MERRPAFAPNQTNPSGIGKSGSMATENSVVISGMLESLLDRHFPVPTMDHQFIFPAPVANPWFFYPRDLVPYQNRMAGLPYSNNMHGFCAYSITNHATRFAAPPGFHPHSSVNTTVPLQIRGAAGPSSVDPSHDFIGTEQAPEPNGRFYICSICEKTFYSRQSLSGHRASHSMLIKMEKDRAPFRSPVLNLEKEVPRNSSIAAAHASNGKSVIEEDSIIIIENTSSEEVEVVELEIHAKSEPDTATSKVLPAEEEELIDLSLSL